jgi:hypothetical protein
MSRRDSPDEFPHGLISQASANFVRSLLNRGEVFVEGAPRDAGGLDDVFSYCSATVSLTKEDRHSRSQQTFPHPFPLSPRDSNPNILDLDLLSSDRFQSQYTAQ